jgi:hypothetical protein
MKITPSTSNKRTKSMALLEPAEWAVGEGDVLVALDPELVDNIPP